MFSFPDDSYFIFAEVVQEVLKEHESSYVEDDLRDFIDAFLKESKEGKDGNAYFNVSFVGIIENLHRNTCSPKSDRAMPGIIVPLCARFASHIVYKSIMSGEYYPQETEA